MSDELKHHTSLLVIQSGSLNLVTDLLDWVQRWCDGLYKDVVIRNTRNGGYEILGILKKENE